MIEQFQTSGPPPTCGPHHSLTEYELPHIANEPVHVMPSLVVTVKAPPGSLLQSQPPAPGIWLGDAFSVDGMLFGQHR